MRLGFLARTEVTPVFIQNFTSSVADFGELVKMASGTFSLTPTELALDKTKRSFAVSLTVTMTLTLTGLLMEGLDLTAIFSRSSGGTFVVSRAEEAYDAASQKSKAPRSPKTGDIVGTAELEDNGPEGAAADGKGHIFVNNEGKSTIQVVEVKTWKATASWPLAPCEGPTGIA
jgi:hypothetical protein